MDGGTAMILSIFGLFGGLIAAWAMYLIIDGKYEKRRESSVAWKRDHEAEWKSARTKALMLCWLPVVIGLLMSVPLIINIADSPSSHAYVCDYCGETSEHSFTVGKQNLCYSCYELYKKGK